ncbi:putative major facilitator, sugar transporter, MFS transporter superfamily [Helianthus anomalus]
MYRFVVLFALNLFYMIESKHQNPSTHQRFVLNEKIDQYSVFGSILTIGAMVGTFVHGKIAYRLGRRMVPVYIAEISPQNLRGAFTTVNKLMICVGVSVMWLIGAFIPGAP